MNQQAVLSFQQECGNLASIGSIVLAAFNKVNPLFGYHPIAYPGFYLTYAKRFMVLLKEHNFTKPYEEMVRQSFTESQLRLNYVTDSHIKKIALFIQEHIADLETLH